MLVRKIILFFTLLSVSIFFQQSTVLAKKDKVSILAIVNDEPITSYDLRQKLKLIAKFSSYKSVNKIPKEVRNKILQQMIEETLKIQEGKRKGIEVTEKEIEVAIETLAQQSKQTANTLYTYLKQNGISTNVFKKQIRSNIVWTKLTNAQLKKSYTPSGTEVKEYVEQLRSKIGQTQYRVGEIYLPITKNNDAPKVKKLANYLINEIKKGASFSQIALQFSKSPSARRGGDLGWLSENQLTKNVRDVVTSLKKKRMSKPFKSDNGYRVLLLIDKQVLDEKNLKIPSNAEIKKILYSKKLQTIAQDMIKDLKKEAYVDIK